MDFLNQMKQNASSAIGQVTSASSSSSSSGESGGMGKTLLYIVVLALFIAIGYWAYTNYIAPMLSANANQRQGSSKVDGDVASSSSFDDAPIAELYLFKTDWCPHCKKALPIFESVKEEYESKTVNGYRVIFKVVDCEREPNIADKFNIEGYPTIKLVKDNQVIEYDAKPDKEHLVKFLNTVI
jgi:thiol-disulfide isomerase/thioredoxin